MILEHLSTSKMIHKGFTFTRIERTIKGQLHLDWHNTQIFKELPKELEEKLEATFQKALSQSNQL